MNIEERVKITILAKYYGKLLTAKQQEILEMYVDNNLSLQEVSEELGISRQAVKDALDTAIISLNSTEEKLHFVERDAKIKQLLENGSKKQLKEDILAILEDI